MFFQYQLEIMNEYNFCLNEIKNVVINQRDKEFYNSSNQNSSNPILNAIGNSKNKIPKTRGKEDNKIKIKNKN